MWIFRSILLTVLMVTVATGPVVAQEAPAAEPTAPDATVPSATDATTAQPSPIVWRLKTPFRFFKNPEHFETYAEVARGIAESEQRILETERALAEQTDGVGWAAAVYEHVADEACWYEAPATTSGEEVAKKPAEPCGAYIKPTSHTVQLSAPSLAKACIWTVGPHVHEQADCSKPLEVAIPYPEGAPVMLTSEGAEVARRIIKVDDILVVGLGDSFGAGDGLPDRPVSFRVNRPMSYDDERSGYPQRYPLSESTRYTLPAFHNRAAGWAHRNCHRSLYSHQLRTALHLALEDPAQQRSVTYLGLACSGATMLNMFDVYKSYDEPAANGDPPHVRRQVRLSQLDVLATVLCAPGAAKPDEAVNYNEGEALEVGPRVIRVATCAPGQRLRRPDLVLLSVGGNDVGFSGLVSNASLRGQFLGVVKLFAEDPRITPDKARAFVPRLSTRYGALARALQAAAGLDMPDRVLLTAYPQMHENAEGKVCASGRGGFDVSAAWNLQGKAVAAAEQFMTDHVSPAMAKAAADAGWTLVDRHRTAGAFKARGLCAVTADEQQMPQLANLKFPRFRENGADSGWLPFKPDDYRHYAPRQRFFLTPNDAFLGTHFHTTHIPIMDGGPDVQMALWSAYSGAFHPTAEGQAAIADAVLLAAREKLASRSGATPR